MILLLKQGGWQHERKSGLKNDELETILKWFSYFSLFEGNYNFDEEYLKASLFKIGDKLGIHIDFDNVLYDLNTSISIIIKDGIEYTFPHKSLQEYFAASLIKSLDNDKKIKIYTERFSKFFDFSSGGNTNFYKLCYELDKVNFLKFFLIPQLKLAFPENKNDKNEIFNIICDKICLDFLFIRNEYEKIESGLIHFSSTKYNDLFCIAPEIDKIMLKFPDILQENFITFVKRYSHNEKQLKYFENNAFSIKLENINHMDQQVVDFIKLHGIIDVIYNCYNEIWIYIKKLELEIEKDEKGISELLDIL